MPKTHDLTVDHVVDGDTVVGTVVLASFLGMQMAWKGRVRLVTVNAPELNTPEGDAAKAYVDSLIKPGQVVQTSSSRDFSDQFGRLLADVLVEVPGQPAKGAQSLSQLLLDTGNAVPMAGKTLAEHFGENVIDHSGKEPKAVPVAKLERK